LTPTWCNASFTALNFDFLIIASIFFMIKIYSVVFKICEK
jgi:hypothetical protein